MKNKMETMKETLKADLRKMYSSGKSKDMGICNRINNLNFVKILKDGNFSYREDVLLCERFFSLAACKMKKQYVFEPTETIGIYNRLADLLKKEPSQEVSEQILEAEKKLQEHVEVSAVEKLVYENIFSGEDIEIIPIKSLEKDMLELMVETIASFILMYFSCISITNVEERNFSLFTVNNEDYTDVVIQINVALQVE